jgi:cytochrome c5
MKTGVGLMVALLSTGAAMAGEDEEKRGARRGGEIYRQTCATCHDAGVGGAPKLGDRKAWAPRIKEGKRTMVRMAIKGIRAMPPRGGNPSLSDEEMERAVIYLLNKSGGKFEE